MDKPKYARVDYYYEKKGTRARTSATLSVSQNLHLATTESAVMSYLRQRHPGCEIYLMGLEWS
jgi:hypothetical protein